jgi:hypothetical protein
MNPEKIVFGFFIVLALTLNVGFVYGDIEDPNHHHWGEFIAVLLVNIAATIVKLGDRSQVGAVLLSTSLVAVLQLLVAAGIWAATGFEEEAVIQAMPSIVSLSVGAVVANIVSVMLLMIETVTLGR